VQLKCTARGVLTTEQLTYQIKLKNYDDLRYNDYQVPRILVLVTVPNDVNSWLNQNHDQLVLCHCGYWLSLRGMAAVYSDAEDPRVTIRLPRSQQFTVASLKELIATVGRGEKP
jgi:hypothetical protein